MQCTKSQRRHLECNSLRHAEPMKADERRQQAASLLVATGRTAAACGAITVFKPAHAQLLSTPLPKNALPVWDQGLHEPTLTS